MRSVLTTYFFVTKVAYKIAITKCFNLLTFWWLAGLVVSVGYETERSTVQFPMGALPSNNSGQVVHTYLPV